MSVEAKSELMDLFEVLIAVNDDLDVATYYDRSLKIFSLRPLVIKFAADASLEGTIQVHIVDSQILLYSVLVGSLKIVIASLSEDLSQKKGTSTTGTKSESGSTTRDSRILTGGLSTVIFR